MIHVVLHCPEIPPNTGNIIRTCMATNATLDLIKPLGFDISDASFKRAGLDYLRSFKFNVYDNFDDFINKCKPLDKNTYIITRFGDHTHCDIDVGDTSQDYYFIFGGETKGLPDYIHKKYNDHRLRIPMDANARCLNLSNAVAIVVYEALRQQNFAGLSFVNVLEG